MAQQTVNLGSSANDGTGDPLRTAFDKINDNFDEVYAVSATGTNIDISGNKITSTDTDGNLVLDTNGTGIVVVDISTSLRLEAHTDNAVLFMDADGDVSHDAKITWNAGTSIFSIEDLSINSSTISTVTNANIVLDPHGTGHVSVDSDIKPSADAQKNLGSASLQWLTVFGGTGTFSTSTSAGHTLLNPGSAPGSPTNGMIYYDNAANKFKGYANGAWVDLH